MLLFDSLQNHLVVVESVDLATPTSFTTTSWHGFEELPISLVFYTLDKFAFNAVSHSNNLLLKYSIITSDTLRLQFDYTVYYLWQVPKIRVVITKENNVHIYHRWLKCGNFLKVSKIPFIRALPIRNLIAYFKYVTLLKNSFHFL